MIRFIVRAAVAILYLVLASSALDLAGFAIAQVLCAIIQGES